ncbi:MAG TPA: histidinol dehydrogenase [Methanoregulaceae archaeon]|nr:histidinol dehydrogenase [Methanoregulaceae archaeon]
MWQQIEIETWVTERKSGIEDVREPVAEIIRQVRESGDAALFELSRKFDGVALTALAVTAEEREDAYQKVDPDLVDSLIEAEARIAGFHALSRPEDLWLRQTAPGITLGIKTTPLERIGAYIPGGRASYPSTALMCTVPARIAGVASICCCSPPPVHPATLVALDIAGVEEIYQVGGAQAIAAMAIGTETIEPVQKIVGPGNVYVTAAKIMLRDEAEIDFPAGPSEIAIIADENAEAEFIAADIIAQAEHDPHSACVLIATDVAVAEKTGEYIGKMVPSAERKEIIAKALEHSGYYIASCLDDAIDAADYIAPEHLSVQVRDPMYVMSRIHHAGAIFIGPDAAVACGDFATGTNHVLPTAGYAKSYSGLNVSHFMKTTSVQIIEREGLEAIGDIVETIADAEGLHAHADSVRIRRKRP